MAVTDKLVTEYQELGASSVDTSQYAVAFDAASGLKIKLSEIAKYSLSHYQLATTKGTKSVKELIESSVAPSSIAEFPDADNYATKTYVDQNGGKINEIKVNGNTVTPVNKVVSITTPTKITDLTDAGDYATKTYVAQNGGKIDKIQVNGTDQTISGKTVNIAVPTRVADLTDSGNYATKTYVDQNAGKIDKIQVNGAEQTITNKTVNIAVPVNVTDLADQNNYYTKTDVDGFGFVTHTQMLDVTKALFGYHFQKGHYVHDNAFSFYAPPYADDGIVAGFVIEYHSGPGMKFYYFSCNVSNKRGNFYTSSGSNCGQVYLLQSSSGPHELVFTFSDESIVVGWAKGFLVGEGLV